MADVRPSSPPSRGPTPLDQLDDEFIARQDLVARALESGDEDRARDEYLAAGQLVVNDADDYRWHISAPTFRELKPLYRYRYTYRRGLDGPLDRDPVAARSRFASFPSLARSYAKRIGGDGGLLRWIVLWSEPLGYVAAIAIAIGLWFLLGDVIGDLPELVVFSLIVVAAAGLWLATRWLGGIRYREADRTARLTRVAAIGVTGWIPWIATIGFDDLPTEVRIAFSAVIVLLLAWWAFQTDGGVAAYLITLGAWLAFVPSLSAAIAEQVSADADIDGVAVTAFVGAAAVAFLPLTALGARRWIPGVIIGLAAITSLMLLAFVEGSFGAVGSTFGIAFGALAAGSCWWSRRSMHERLRGVHQWSTLVLGGMTFIVALTVGPWDVIWDWLEDVPLPVVLVILGSALLMSIAYAIRTAVGRVGEGD